MSRNLAQVIGLEIIAESISKHSNHDRVRATLLVFEDPRVARLFTIEPHGKGGTLYPLIGIRLFDGN